MARVGLFEQCSWIAVTRIDSSVPYANEYHKLAALCCTSEWLVLCAKYIVGTQFDSLLRLHAPTVANCGLTLLLLRVSCYRGDFGRDAGRYQTVRR
jgi:hypothetical protein